MKDKIRLIYNKIENRIDEICDDGFVLKENQQEYETLTDLEDFIDSLPEEPKCIYNRTLDERKKFCKYCSAACAVRIEEEPASEDLIEEIDKIWKTCNPIDEGMGVETANIHIEQFDDIARHFTDWQKQKDYKMYAHLPLKDIHDAWQELKNNKPDIENSPAICFCRGANWRENQMKEALQTEYEKGRFEMREEMMKDAVEGEYWIGEIHLDTPIIQGYDDGDRIKFIPIKTE